MKKKFSISKSKIKHEKNGTFSLTERPDKDMVDFALYVLLKADIKNPTEIELSSLDLVVSYFYKMVKMGTSKDAIYYARIGTNKGKCFVKRGTDKSLKNLFSHLIIGEEKDKLVNDIIRKLLLFS